MKTFLQYIAEQSEDSRADINIPYKTPEDISQIMSQRGGESSEPGSPAVQKMTRSEQNQKRNKTKRMKTRERKESGILSGQVNTAGKMTMRDIAKQMGVHHTLIGQIEDSAFKKLMAGINQMQSDPAMLQAWLDVNKSRNVGKRKVGEI
jgi:DNA-directed RNA polymerase sigma subunit (sigma70/sigma32)